MTFPGLLSDRTKWSETPDVDSDGHRMFEEFFSGLAYFAESLRNFRGQLDIYFEPLSQRSAEAYAEAYAAYFSEMATAGELFFPEQKFNQSFSVQLCFVPTVVPDETEKSFWRRK